MGWKNSVCLSLFCLLQRYIAWIAVFCNPTYCGQKYRLEKIIGLTNAIVVLSKKTRLDLFFYAQESTAAVAVDCLSASPRYSSARIASWRWMMKIIVNVIFLVLGLLAGEAMAATCTSRASGNWNSSGTWSCTSGSTPGSTYTVILASSYTVSLNNNNRTVASLTINAGATLNDDGQDLTVTGNVVNNGTFGTNGGALIMTGTNATLSGSGTFNDTDVQIDASGISLPVGSSLNFTNQAQVRVGRDSAGTFTIEGSIIGTDLVSGDRILRVYQDSSVTINGSITASNAYIHVERNASVINNGTVSVQYLASDNNATAVWTQGVNSSLNLSQTPSNTWRGTLNASATDNTVTYSANVTPLTPSSNTYYNLGHPSCAAVTGFTILGIGPCVTTTLATGLDPAPASVAPGAAATDVNLFTLQTSSGSEAISSVTVNLSTSSGIGLLAITDSAGTVLGSTASPATGSNIITVSGVTATTTLTSLKVRVTPLSHALMPAPPGAAYTITAPVTAWAGSNMHAGSDTNTNALTIDNLSPTGATATSGSVGAAKASLNWTSSSAMDFNTTSGSVVYRWAGTAGLEVPGEGSTATVGTANGTATVACVVSSAASTALVRIDGTGGSADCTTTALTIGQVYTYKVFQQDSSGNYDVGVTIGPITPYGAVSPTVSTVVASPTSVAADNATSATVTVTLKDSASTPVPGKTVTLAAGSGSSVITTVGGTTNASGVATFTVKNGTVEGPITYTATDTTDSIVVTQTAQVTFTTPTLCFSDNFDRGTGLLATSNWTRTKSVGTTFDAEIVNNRLRLTDASTNRSTAVHLQRLFPGAGNKVEAVFDFYAYNGSGADGVVITLSDSSVAPVAGAYGGSLGYAQRTGIDGFAGGWIGVGLDEYGNYSNATEGRVGGNNFLPDNVTIRGSGSGQSGYNYHTNAAASGLDSAASTTPAPGHRYKVIVDHSDGVHAYTSVDRDTTGTGNSYVNIIPVYDAKAIPTQAAVPPYWYFSFTGSTGSSSNIHEIDNLTICTAQPITTPTLDHVRIIHDGSALTCAAETVTLKACANAACSALYTGSVTVSLAAISGATWSSNTVTFTGGQALVTLTKGSVGTVTLGGSVTAPSSMAATCYNGSTSGNCSLTYSSNACVFDAVETGGAAYSPIYTKLAGTTFNLDIRNQSGVSQTVTQVEIVDASSGTCSSYSGLANSTTSGSSWSFTGAQVRNFAFNYANAVRDARIRIITNASTSCSSDNFAIRPTSFSVNSPNALSSTGGATATPIVKAGAAFELDATSVNNYTGTAVINNNRVVAHSGAAQNGTVGGTFSAATSGSSWISKGTSFTYSEVGNFHFTPWGVYDDGSFANVDRGKSTPECVIDNKLGSTVDPADPNVIDGNGKFGCYFGGTDTVGGTITSPYFGRFIPDHFSLSDSALTNRSDINSGAGCSPGSAFTYMGEPIKTSFTLTAKNGVGNTTQNYTGAYAKLSASPAWTSYNMSDSVGLWGIATGYTYGGSTCKVLFDSATPSVNSFGSCTGATPGLFIGRTAGPRVTISSSSVSAWANGIATFGTNVTLERGDAPDGSYGSLNIGVAPKDSDGVQLQSVALNLDTDNDTFSERTSLGTTQILFGRLSLQNAYGSELLALPMPLTAEYWNGTSWVTNAVDSCTALTAPADGSGLALNLASTGTTTSTLSNPLDSGDAGFSLAAPGATHTGYVDVTINSSPPWLDFKWDGVHDTDPTARATFGIYKGNSRFIYIRELY